MHKAGTLLIWLGLAFCLIGLLFGFGAMFLDADHQAVNLLGLIPIGFMALLGGVVMVLFGRPSQSRGYRDPD